jgi:hypothetical protein
LLLVTPAVKFGLQGRNIVPATNKTRKQLQTSTKENAGKRPTFDYVQHLEAPDSLQIRLDFSRYFLEFGKPERTFMNWQLNCSLAAWFLGAVPE